MPRKNSDGKYVISAGDVASYTVCPMSWALEQQGVKKDFGNASKEGLELQKEWKRGFNDAVFFTRSVNLIIALIILIVLVLVLKLFVISVTVQAPIAEQAFKVDRQGDERFLISYAASEVAGMSGNSHIVHWVLCLG